MKVYDCEQGTEEWFAARLGFVTASHFKDVLNKKSGRETYMLRLLGERVTGIREESYSNKYMEDGTELEPEAREHFEWIMNTTVEQVGFVEKSDDVGCSPDGLIEGGEGLLEIKCPKLTTHLKYIIKGVLPATYKAQVQGQLWVCERQWCVFMSYCPDYEKEPMWTIRVERDEAYLTLLSAAMATFVTELKEMENQL